MKYLRAVNRKAVKIDEFLAAEYSDVFALQQQQPQPAQSSMIASQNNNSSTNNTSSNTSGNKTSGAVRLLDIHTVPSVVHKGDTFKVVATVNNNMQKPILYTNGKA